MSEDFIERTDPDDVKIDPELRSAMLAGMEQMRATIFGPTNRAAVPYKALEPLAERACIIVADLTLNEVVLLGSYLAAAAKTQLQLEALDA